MRPDEGGLRLRRRRGDGRGVRGGRYALDKASRRTRIDSPAGTFGLGYCAWNGNVSAVTNAHGLVTTYAYDVMDRVTNITWTAVNGASLGGFTYAYDAAGRIVSLDHALGNSSQPSQLSKSSHKSYAYDNLDRLAADGDVAYTYDAAGNRMTRTENGETVTYTLGVGDRLASYGRAASPLAADGGYDVFHHNCHDFIDELIREYFRIGGK